MMVMAKVALNRELIARTALTLTDPDGLAGLSMRKLGSRLGVEAMSLYHYVDSKADLLDAMLEILFSEIQLAVDVPEHDWETALRRGLKSFHDVMVSYRGAWELFATRPATGEHALRVLKWSVSRLMVVGLDEKQANLALNTATSFVIGHVATEVGLMSISRSEEGRAELEAAETPTSEFMKVPRDIMPEEMFQTGLDILVAGLRVQYHLP